MIIGEDRKPHPTRGKTAKSTRLVRFVDLDFELKRLKPAGEAGDIQFNKSGEFEANSNLSWDDDNNKLYVKGGAEIDSMTIKGGVGSITGYGAVPNNTVMGYEALQNPTIDQNVFTGVGNTAIGAGALKNLTVGTYNVAIGEAALLENTTGYSNTAINSSLINNIDGNNNVGIGDLSLFHINGDNNVGIGYQAGLQSVNGSTPNLVDVNNAVFIGQNTRPLNDISDNEIIIGGEARGNGSNTATIGNDQITKTIVKGDVGVGVTVPLTKLHVDGEVTLEPQATAPAGVEGAIYYDSTTKKHYGFDGTTWNALY